MNRFYTAYKNLYNVQQKTNNYRIIEINIKYKTKKLFELYCSVLKVFTCPDYCILCADKVIYVFGNNEFILKNIPLDHMDYAVIVEKYLIVSSCMERKTLIYDIINYILIKIINISYRLFSVSPNGRILCRGIFDEIFDSVSDFINLKRKFNLGDVRGFLFWLNNDAVGYLTSGIFRRFILTRSSYVKQKIPFPESEWFYNDLYIVEDCIFCFQDYYHERMLLIKGNKTKVINNNFGIIFYNSHYDVFVNNRLKLYKLTNNAIVRFKFGYDLWHDIDKPEYIQYVIDVLLDCILFPVEICNVVYQQLVVLFFKIGNIEVKNFLTNKQCEVVH